MIRACLLTLLLSGCASISHCPPLPGGLDYCLQSSLEVPAFAATQDVRVRYGNLDERLIAQLEVDGDGMRLVGMTPMGQRLISAQYDNRAATADKVPGDRFEATALLSLIQLATWPEASVRSGLGDRWRLEETPSRRRILRDGQPVLVIDRLGSPPHYRHLTIHLPDAGLSLSIDGIETGSP